MTIIPSLEDFSEYVLQSLSALKKHSDSDLAGSQDSDGICDRILENPPYGIFCEN